MKTSFQIFIEQWAREQTVQAEYDYLSKFSNEEIQKQWDVWDGMALFVFNGKVVNDYTVWGEMSRRGLETGI